MFHSEAVLLLQTNNLKNKLFARRRAQEPGECGHTKHSHLTSKKLPEQKVRGVFGKAEQ